LRYLAGSDLQSEPLSEDLLGLQIPDLKSADYKSAPAGADQ